MTAGRSCRGWLLEKARRHRRHRRSWSSRERSLWSPPEQVKQTGHVCHAYQRHRPRLTPTQPPPNTTTREHEYQAPVAAATNLELRHSGACQCRVVEARQSEARARARQCRDENGGRRRREREASLVQSGAGAAGRRRRPGRHGGHSASTRVRVGGLPHPGFCLSSFSSRLSLPVCRSKHLVGRARNDVRIPKIGYHFAIVGCHGTLWP
jgi:hypothetical protein